MSLRTYQAKRDFTKTLEPAGRTRRGSKAGKPREPEARRFVVQKHDATRLHYDFRLEIGGVLKSWAVPKGPSLDPPVRSLAVEVEDHPLEYGAFEGTIPKGEYGGGTVMLWDHGTYSAGREDPARAYRAGKLRFTLKGRKLKGAWTLVRMREREGDKHRNWLLMKVDDRYARSKDEYDVLEKKSRSVASGRSLEKIAAADGQTLRTRKAPGAAPARPRRRAAALRPEARALAGAAAALPGAVKRGLPHGLKPQLATLAEDAPTGDGWLHEIKFDGYRLLANLRRGGAALITRKGLDWADRFPELTAELEQLGLGEGVLDGEVIALDDRGVSTFSGLQLALKEGRTEPLVFMVFDVLYWGGCDLRACTLADRRSLLEEVVAALPAGGRVRLSGAIEGRGKSVLSSACRSRLEGIISKRLSSRYRAGERTEDWLKLKCGHRQEFVIGGFSDPRRSRPGLGSLLLGYHNPRGELVFAGRVGAGIEHEQLTDLRRTLEKLERDDPPFVNRPTGAQARGAHWVEPELVAEVSFTEWTRDGRVRHPVFHGLRSDKSPREITRERPRSAPRVSAKAASPVPRVPAKPARKSRSRPAAERGAGPKDRGPARGGSGGAEVAGVVISHPDRVVFDKTNITKLELARYYEKVADWILPHVVNRPLSLLRCPEGGRGPCFFNKHLEMKGQPGLRTIPIEESKGTADYLVATDVRGLVALVQMNALEFHVWGSREDDPENADRLVFDLDPGEGTEWPDVVTAARLVRKRLERVGLRSFAKLSGGKGVHVVVPLSRRTPWKVAKAFSRGLAESIAREEPERYTATMAKALRHGRVFIDYLRNDRGSTSVAALSARARPGGTISVPVGWESLSRAEPRGWTVRTAPARLTRERRDPWAEFFKVKQWVTVTAAEAVGLK